MPLFADDHDYRYVEVNGNQLAYLCKGSGDLTFLLISGMGLDAHSTYKNTFHNAKPNGYQLCFYDRAGTGNSALKNPGVRTMAELASELEVLTRKAQMKQLVLVPHSFGGFIARAFAHRNPDLIEGIIFVDSAHESWYEDLRESMSDSAWTIMESIIEWERNSHSFEDFAEASRQSDLYSFKRDHPVIVLSRGLPHVSIRQTKMRYRDVDAYTDSWNRSQKALHTLSENTDVVIMKYASHLFDETDPWIVLEQIEKMHAKIHEKPNPAREDL